MQLADAEQEEWREPTATQMWKIRQLLSPRKFAQWYSVTSETRQRWMDELGKGAEWKVRKDATLIAERTRADAEAGRAFAAQRGDLHALVAAENM